MTSMSASRTVSLPLRETSFAQQRLAYRNNVVKWLSAILLAGCFWFAVPYTFPLQIDPDPLKAAAAEAVAYQGNISRQVAMPLVLLISLYALYRLPKVGRFVRGSKVSAITLSYFVWALASLAWSTEPAVTSKRLFVLAINGIFVITLALVTSVQELALFGFLSTAAVAMLALAADVLVLHTFAPTDPDYRFMGVMTANYQAMNLFVCLVCGLTLGQKSPQRFRWLSPFLVLFSVLLFLTRARIGAFLFFAVAFFVAVRVAKRWFQPQVRAFFLLGSLTLVLPIILFSVGRSGQGAVAAVFMMGRQDNENTASLSNRAPLWGELLQSVKEHPILGRGYEAFWTPERVEKVSVDQGWVVPHAHNTYLDQTLSLGLVGCLLYGGMMIGSCVVAWRRYRRTTDESDLFPALLLSWLAVLGVTESIPIAPYLPTLIAYACVLKMGMEERASITNDKTCNTVHGFQPQTWTGALLSARPIRAEGAR